MIRDNLRKQRLIILNSSLFISILLILVRSLFLPHSLNYTLLYSILSISLKHSLFTPTVYFLCLLIVFIIISIFSVQYFLQNFQRNQYKSIVLLLITLLTFISLWLAQYPIILPDFYSLLREREAVVAMIKSGDLQPNESQRIKLDNHIRYKVYQMQLPPQYAHLSKSGERGGEINIVADQDKKAKIIVFFTSVGKFKGEPNYTAWMYRFDTGTSIENHIFGVKNLTYFVWLLDSFKINQNWFWVDVIED
ncbi:hypothetical protein SAMD00079811_23010 [Scytonema sp. HK-05]|uniref:hypothetical protein n=1 Tax=Scytonema sp. HK-05 TaxID=1137095 RepID=UPI000935F9D2|nr:hypothetical protein [Scytonema sp. HK-05]OKH60494.1 hypothetical protein NIES2130_03650 [Scytonema sp. HK-05]BAY44700.1 hypothetical protein SAMD00079811_23010 [Scytonema sp. HK-05]